MSPTPFQIDVPAVALDELRSRIGRTRFGVRTGGEPWQAGADPEYLRELLAFWRTEFDWRAAQQRLNAHAHYRARVDGDYVHFVHTRADRAVYGDRVLPLVLTHGWPSSFVEMLPLVRLLTDPLRHGGEADDAFDVVIPSLPGFLFSDLPSRRPLTRARVAKTWTILMTEVLGYMRFGAFGGDVGATVTAWLGAAHAAHVLGIHLIHPPFPADFDPPPSEEEQAYLDAEAAYDQVDGGYSAIQGTRPDTIAAALLDSPVGLAAWILDKYRAWSDCHGDLESRFDRDTLLTILTLYWTTRTIGTSFWNYYDYEHNPPRPRIEVPTAVTLSAEPVMKGFPRSLAERSCSDIQLWHQPPAGGHFMPMEEPELLAGDIRAFFRPLREDARRSVPAARSPGRHSASRAAGHIAQAAGHIAVDARPENHRRDRSARLVTAPPWPPAGTAGDDLPRFIRLAAYAVCLAADALLLTRLAPGEADAGRWTLPGGGLEFGERPSDAALRELEEETGLTGTIESVVAVDSEVLGPRPGRHSYLFAVRILYRVRITGGRLRHETAGTTDQAAWIALSELDAVPIVPPVNVAAHVVRSTPGTAIEHPPAEI